MSFAPWAEQVQQQVLAGQRLSLVDAWLLQFNQKISYEVACRWQPVWQHNGEPKKSGLLLTRQQ